jgi:hypothetical protein
LPPGLLHLLVQLQLLPFQDHGVRRRKLRGRLSMRLRDLLAELWMLLIGEQTDA